MEAERLLGVGCHLFPLCIQPQTWKVFNIHRAAMSFESHTMFRASWPSHVGCGCMYMINMSNAGRGVEGCGNPLHSNPQSQDRGQSVKVLSVKTIGASLRRPTNLDSGAMPWIGNHHSLHVTQEQSEHFWDNTPDTQKLQNMDGRDLGRDRDIPYSNNTPEAVEPCAQGFHS